MSKNRSMKACIWKPHITKNEVDNIMPWLGNPALNSYWPEFGKSILSAAGFRREDTEIRGLLEVPSCCSPYGGVTGDDTGLVGTLAA
jgi:hypothetical protein